ncbi:MAG TPA: ankyrin repeat domain-containing protein [Acidimicrobiales bacterium]|nr:ankyrin repeat domain-containing protein [Acidimicrobiales bacterium]
MSQKRLCDRPSLDRLKDEARELQRTLRQSNPAAKLSDAQRELAREYGFASWPRLKQYVDLVHAETRNPHDVGALDDPGEEFLRLACLTYGADDSARPAMAQKMLDADPSLGTASVFAAAAVGAADQLRAAIASDPTVVQRRGGPFDWVPLLYLTYSRATLPDRGWDAVDAARVLLDAGADPNAGFLWDGMPSPFTALTGAFGEGEDAPNQPPHPQWHELARLLLERGADPNDTQVLYNRHFRPGTEWLELLLEFGMGKGDGGPWHARLAPMHNSPTQNLEDQLTWAATRGYADRVALVLAHGVDPNGLGMNHPTLDGKTAMELAVAGGHKQVVGLLLAHGVRAPAMDPIDRLLMDVMAGDEFSARQRIDRDRLSTAEATRRRPHAVATAAEAGRAEAVRLLVRLGWDVNHKQRTTALHDAVWNGDRAIVELLLALGADPRITDDDFNSTPAGWAAHTHNDELRELLLGAEARMA